VQYVTESGTRDSKLAERVDRLGEELIEYADVVAYPAVRARTAAPNTDGETTR
jgi:hypothetical protein